jgi:hypothetical protein
MSHKRAVGAAAGLAAVLCASTLSAAGTAQARGGSGVRAAGSCAVGSGVWTLKAKADDGRLEIEFEVDTNHAGQRWHVRITDNTHLVTDRYATTQAPSGSFTVHARPANRAGTDVIRARATRGDRVCSGTVRF